MNRRGLTLGSQAALLNTADNRDVVNPFNWEAQRKPPPKLLMDRMKEKQEKTQKVSL